MPKFTMKKFATLGAVLLAVLFGYYQQQHSIDIPAQENNNDVAAHAERNAIGADDSAVEQAIEQHRSDVQLIVQGLVKKTLSDDNNGSRHQRFIVELPSGHTILVAHNIDLAERIPDLQSGDVVELYGEYVWNERGGVLHWTHRDPAGRHVAGWIKHKSHTYQ